MSPGGLHSNGAIECVLFDLDGTLVDTAPDMVAVLLDLQLAHRLEPVPYELARSQVSNGAIGLIRLAFPEASEAEVTDLHGDYLARYERSVCVRSSVFPGLGDLLTALERVGCPWGVVTNKPQRMTEPLLAGLGLAERAACIVSGDTLPQRKPDPSPLLLASRLAGVLPGRSVYVGDAARDIEAGRAAGMATVAALYGYVTADDDPAAWRADQMAADTEELAHILLKAVNLDAGCQP